jgi:hypothetical protein
MLIGYFYLTRALPGYPKACFFPRVDFYRDSLRGSAMRKPFDDRVVCRQAPLATTHPWGAFVLNSLSKWNPLCFTELRAWT